LTRRARVFTAVAVLLGMIGLGLTAAAAFTGTSGPVTVNANPTTALVGGDAITITAAVSGGTITEVRAHICAAGAGISNSFDFGYQGVYCAKGTNDASGDFQTSKSYANVPDTASDPLTFRARTGTFNWNDEDTGAPHTLTCNATNPCDLVIQVADSVAPGFHYITAPLTYLGTPGAPTLNSATAGDSSALVTYGAPTTTGNGTIDKYVVTAHPSAGADVVKDCGTATTCNVTGLSNFVQYAFTVTARNVGSNTSSHFTSAASNSVNGTPGPAGPTSLSATPGDSSVQLSWIAPSNTTNLDNYRITILNAADNSVFGTPSTGGTATTFNVSGLANDASYTFTVAAHYGGATPGYSSESNQVTATPRGAYLYQTITVTRPAYSLVISQECATPATTFDPTDKNLENGTTCSVSLGNASLVTSGANSGKYFQANGAISEITIVDARDTDPGWTVTGQVSNFTSPTSNTIQAADLGWTPAAPVFSAPITSPDGSYNMNVVQGAAVASGATATDTAGGLASPRVLGQGTAGHGYGLAKLNATLQLLIPVFVHSGTYTGTLTLTAV
jgi:hypothetical protein